MKRMILILVIVCYFLRLFLFLRLCWGSLLGAVREKNRYNQHIPWEHDGDICINEQDRTRFTVVFSPLDYYHSTPWQHNFGIANHSNISNSPSGCIGVWRRHLHRLARPFSVYCCVLLRLSVHASLKLFVLHSLGSFALSMMIWLFFICCFCCCCYVTAMLFFSCRIWT